MAGDPTGGVVLALRSVSIGPGTDDRHLLLGLGASGRLAWKEKVFLGLPERSADAVEALAITDDGCVAVAGTTESPVQVLGGKRTIADGPEAFVAMLSSTHALRWMQVVRADGPTLARVAIRPDAKVVFTYRRPGVGTRMGVTQILDPDGGVVRELVQPTRAARSMCVNKDNEVVLAGDFTEGTRGAWRSGSFVAKYSPTLEQVWEHEFDTSETLRVACDPNGEVFLWVDAQPPEWRWGSDFKLVTPSASPLLVSISARGSVQAAVPVARGYYSVLDIGVRGNPIVIVGDERVPPRWSIVEVPIPLRESSFDAQPQAAQ